MPHLFETLSNPRFRLAHGEAVLSASEFESLRLTVEDFRYVTSELTDELVELPAQIRSRATILRRLLCHRDIFRAGKLVRPDQELRVTARMLDFEPPHPSVLMSCGSYHLKGDILPGLSLVFSIRGVAPLERPTWSYRENADVSLAEYLDGLAIAVLGARIRRREVIKYVADKKAAHVSDKRGHMSERAMDRAWGLLTIAVVSEGEGEVALNIAYLELLAVIDALARSASINQYIDKIDAWIADAVPEAGDGQRMLGVPIVPIIPGKREN